MVDVLYAKIHFNRSYSRAERLYNNFNKYPKLELAEDVWIYFNLSVIREIHKPSNKHILSLVFT